MGVAGNVTVLHDRFDYLDADTSQIDTICQVRRVVENPLDNLKLSTIDLAAVKVAAGLYDVSLWQQIV